MRSHSSCSFWIVAVAIASSAACGGATRTDPTPSDSRDAGADERGSIERDASSRSQEASTEAEASACPVDPTKPDDDAEKALGIAGDAELNVRATVSRVDDQTLEMATTAGDLRLSWRGPSLLTRFAVGEDVSVATTRPIQGGGGWSVVRSNRSTAAVFNGIVWHPFDATPLPTKTLGTFAGFPALDYSLEWCCSLVPNGRACPCLGAGCSCWCSYGSLRATFEGASTVIDTGGTGKIGLWAVTNVQSRYIVSAEDAWNARVTLLGPATAADGVTPPGDAGSDACVSRSADAGAATDAGPRSCEAADPGFTACVKACGEPDQVEPTMATCSSGNWQCPAPLIPAAACPSESWSCGWQAGCGPWIMFLDCQTKAMCVGGVWKCP